MRVSTKARYAVSAMVDMAVITENDPARAVSLNDIAVRQELPTAYLEQIFAKLRQAQLVQSIRGAHGGYKLGRPVDTIRIADIIYAVDNPSKATRCDQHSPSGCMSTGKRCLTHNLWEGLDHVIHHYLSQLSLEDIAFQKKSIPNEQLSTDSLTQKVRAYVL